MFAINSSIDTQQFNNHTRRIYSISMYIFQGSMPKHRKWKFSSHINLSIYYFQIYLSKIQVQYWKTHPDPQYLYLMTNVRQMCRFSAGNHHFVKKKYTLYTLCGSRKYPHRNTEGGEGIRGPGNSREEGGWTITITFQAVNFQLSTKIATYWSGRSFLKLQSIEKQYNSESFTSRSRRYTM